MSQSIRYRKSCNSNGCMAVGESIDSCDEPGLTTEVAPHDSITPPRPTPAHCRPPRLRREWRGDDNRQDNPPRSADALPRRHRVGQRSLRGRASAGRTFASFLSYTITIKVLLSYQRNPWRADWWSDRPLNGSEISDPVCRETQSGNQSTFVVFFTARSFGCDRGHGDGTIFNATKSR